MFENLNYTLGVDGYSYDFEAKKVQAFTSFSEGRCTPGHSLLLRNSPYCKGLK